MEQLPLHNGRIKNVTEGTNFVNGDDSLKLFNNHQDYSLKGIITGSDLSDYYFSDQNVDTIQQIIRYNVYKELDKVIDKQSDKELFIIMRSLYLQYGGLTYSTKNEFFKIIRSLNDRVITYSVKNIVSNLKQYDMYVKDISSLPIPMQLPSYDSNKSKTYDISNLLGDIY